MSSRTIAASFVFEKSSPRGRCRTTLRRQHEIQHAGLEDDELFHRQGLT